MSATPLTEREEYPQPPDNKRARGTQAYLAAEYFNEGWLECLEAVRAARASALLPPAPDQTMNLDWPCETEDPVREMDVIFAEYSKTFGRYPDSAMAETVAKVKQMLLMWWGWHRDTVRAALIASLVPPVGGVQDSPNAHLAATPSDGGAWAERLPAAVQPEAPSGGVVWLPADEQRLDEAITRRRAAAEGDASRVLPTFTRDGCMGAAESELAHGDIAWPMGGANPAPAAPGPAASSAVPLSDQRIDEIWSSSSLMGEPHQFARAIETAHGIGAAASPALAPEQSHD